MIYVERHDDDNNLHRFYAIEIARDLFGVWMLTRRWGRVGARLGTGAGAGQCLVLAFETETEAQKMAASNKASKLKREYVPWDKAGEIPGAETAE